MFFVLNLQNNLKVAKIGLIHMRIFWEYSEINNRNYQCHQLLTFKILCPNVDNIYIYVYSDVKKNYPRKLCLVIAFVIQKICKTNSFFIILPEHTLSLCMGNFRQAPASVKLSAGLNVVWKAGRPIYSKYICFCFLSCNVKC